MNELLLERIGVIGTVRFVGNIPHHVVGEESQHPGVEVIVESCSGNRAEGYINHTDIPQIIEYLQKFVEK